MYEDCNTTDVEVCANGGTCRKLGSSYICECPDGYTGLSCQSGMADIDKVHMVHDNTNLQYYCREAVCIIALTGQSREI